jgi:mRNA-degrading endonuclease toxin of MazEF toxin-antitoxin module
VVTSTGYAPRRTPRATSSAAHGSQSRSRATSAQPAIFRPEIQMDGTRTLVLVDQMRAVDASRLGDFTGRLDATEAGEVDRAIQLILGTL